MEYTDELDAMVRAMLTSPEGYPWTLQGFGMLRCDLVGREYRLHVWDHRFRVDNVSDIHDHPWDLESLVMSGRITNVVWEQDLPSYQREGNDYRFKYLGVEMTPGPVTGDEPAERVDSFSFKHPSRTEYGQGDCYIQDKSIVHSTEFKTGTVTLVRRTDRQVRSDGTDRAHVFWPKENGPTRVLAAPVTPAMNQVRTICEVALAMWGQ